MLKTSTIIIVTILIIGGIAGLVYNSKIQNSNNSIIIEDDNNVLLIRNYATIDNSYGVGYTSNMESNNFENAFDSDINSYTIMAFDETRDYQSMITKFYKIPLQIKQSNFYIYVKTNFGEQAFKLSNNCFDNDYPLINSKENVTALTPQFLVFKDSDKYRYEIHCGDYHGNAYIEKIFISQPFEKQDIKVYDLKIKYN